jgi:putative oxidoreductase
VRDVASLYLRFALGLAFLYSVADRFGLLGRPGTNGVSWGTFSRFTAYVATLNWYAPHWSIPALAWVDTVLELTLGLTLIVGLWTKISAWISAGLLLVFALTLSMATGIGSAFQYSVFTASAGAMLLAAAGSSRWTLDGAIVNRSV